MKTLILLFSFSRNDLPVVKMSNDNENLFLSNQAISPNMKKKK